MDRFHYYVVSDRPEEALLQHLVENADITVDLRPIEHPIDGSLRPSEVIEEIRLRTVFVGVCAAAHTRLVHVSSADVYGSDWLSTGSPNGTSHLQTEHQVREDEVLLVTTFPRSPSDIDRTHQQMTQQTIQTYGES